MRNQNTVYLGLFLMVFGLYAYQVKKPAPVEAVPVAVSVAKNQEHLSSSRTIKEIFEQVRSEEIFKNKIDGLSLTPDHEPIEESFTVSLHGEEVYRSGEVAVEQSWNAVIEWAAEFLLSESCLKIEIDAYADDSDFNEKTRAERGSGLIALSISRAEWMKENLLRKTGQVADSRIITVKGLGTKPRGKQVDLKFTCPKY